MDVIHELTAQYDSRKSFYGKAMTDGSNLWSYKTLVASCTRVYYPKGGTRTYRKRYPGGVRLIRSMGETDHG